MNSCYNTHDQPIAMPKSVNTLQHIMNIELDILKKLTITLQFLSRQRPIKVATVEDITQTPTMNSKSIAVLYAFNSQSLVTSQMLTTMHKIVEKVE